MKNFNDWLGYTSRKSGEIQPQMLKKTHYTVMKELDYIKKQQEAASIERDELKKIIEEIKDMTVEIHKSDVRSQ
jgi:uncharacterized protein YaaN involved in tellurite resistance